MMRRSNGGYINPVSEAPVMNDDVYRAAYAATDKLYAELAPLMHGQDYGYEILYGPPVPAASLFILGYQPGCTEADKTMPEVLKRPSKPRDQLAYAYENWRLAKALREIWPAEFMTSMTGGNINFFRAVSVASWRTIPLSLRRRMQAHSLQAMQEMVTADPPERFLVIGHDTLKKIPGHQPGKVLLRSSHTTRPYRLVQEATLWGRPALAVTHLSGAQLSAEDRRRIEIRTRDWAGI
ncbi:hypothetical protein [Asaia bogorensis]|uniref:Uracil-DNA glycosylase n=1 Tax=Asaia bogorensis NBRC 16594 TaxID=1231624 RepID=A0AAN4U3Q5_9PROT|nr:hypothetical protein [Asaia bogorensis]GBQ81657.1 hypothetical protein AA0311_2668 [Asaia bogorensis NBRC 16594]GEL54808.1 hypothetical protein ABO01nite_28150 [Asaia bogorensis NBRC 16594]